MQMPPEYVRESETGQPGMVTRRFPVHGKFNVEWSDGSETTESLSGEGEQWEWLMGRETATLCLDVVRKFTGDDAAALYEPGFHANGWVIALEGGPYEWPIHISEPGKVTWPEGVWVEPVNNWSIALYLKD
jgi:hypothetical protein